MNIGAENGTCSNVTVTFLASIAVVVRGVASKNSREEAGSDLDDEKPLIRS